jgi:N-acetyl-anhydromuramyl-L-alanine amidase AmpD
MLTVALGLSPVVAFGLVAWWARARSMKLEIDNMCDQAPANKRSPRTETVDAVVLHQMGLSRGNDLHRYRLVTAHFVILPDGHIAQLHPTSARLSASHCFNGRSVAIEFAGNLRSADNRWWKPETYGRDTLTAAQIESGRKLLRVLESQGVRFVYAHRQSYSQRGNDPGPDIWASVGQWAIDTLGMSDGGPGYVEGTGQPIPDEWRAAVSDLIS